MNTTKSTNGIQVETMIGEIQAGRDLLGELLDKLRASAALVPPPRVAEGTGVQAAPPARVARGTTPPPEAPPAPAVTGTGRGKANMSDPRLRGVTRLERVFNDWRIVVNVRPDGFEWGGKVWSSLSAIAKAVTGSSRNGYEFFGLEARR